MNSEWIFVIVRVIEWIPAYKVIRFSVKCFYDGTSNEIIREIRKDFIWSKDGCTEEFYFISTKCLTCTIFNLFFTLLLKVLILEKFWIEKLKKM